MNLAQLNTLDATCLFLEASQWPSALQRANWSAIKGYRDSAKNQCSCPGRLTKALYTRYLIKQQVLTGVDQGPGMTIFSNRH